MPAGNLVFAGGKHYVQTMEGWMEVTVEDQKPLSYAELLKKANDPIDPAALFGIPAKVAKGKVTKKGKEAKENKSTANGKDDKVSVSEEKEQSFSLQEENFIA